MCFFIRNDRQTMIARETSFNGNSCNSLAGLLLQNFKLLDVLKTMLTFVKKVVLEYDFRFAEARTEEIGVDLTATEVPLKASLATFHRRIRVAKNLL